MLTFMPHVALLTVTSAMQTGAVITTTHELTSVDDPTKTTGEIAVASVLVAWRKIIMAGECIFSQKNGT
jgi:hypothetical protein